MDKTKNERGQLQTIIDSMETELRQVQEEIAEVTRQNEQVSSKYHWAVSQTGKIRNLLDLILSIASKNPNTCCFQFFPS